MISVDEILFFQLILENAGGEQIDLTTTANRYMVSEIDGLYPPSRTVNQTNNSPKALSGVLLTHPPDNRVRFPITPFSLPFCSRNICPQVFSIASNAINVRFGFVSAVLSKNFNVYGTIKKYLALTVVNFQSLLDEHQKVAALLAKEHSDFTELTQELLHTFVSRIEVHERTIDSFEKEHQDVDIYFTHIGALK